MTINTYVSCLSDLDLPVHVVSYPSSFVGSRPVNSLRCAAQAHPQGGPQDPKYFAHQKDIWVCLKIVYPYTQWLMIIIPIINGYFIGNINPTCSDKPIWQHIKIFPGKITSSVGLDFYGRNPITLRSVRANGQVLQQLRPGQDITHFEGTGLPVRLLDAVRDFRRFINGGIEDVKTSPGASLTSHHDDSYWIWIWI